MVISMAEQNHMGFMYTY